MKIIINIDDKELVRCLIKGQLSDRQSRDILKLVREGCPLEELKGENNGTHNDNT